MSFYPDMMRDLAIMFPRCRSAFDELEEALCQEGGSFTPSSFVFPPAPYYRHDADIFRSGAYAQALVSIYAGCAGLTRMLRDIGVSPDGVVGFGGGDLAALMSSGTAGENPPRPDRVRVLREIYRIVDKAVNHGGMPEIAMLTVVMRRAGEIDEVVESFPQDKVTLVVDFSPRQKTFAVVRDFEEMAMAAFARAGVRAMKMPFDRPFNTRQCDKLVPVLKKFAASWMKHDPVCDVYSCASAERLPNRLRSARADIGERWAKPVRFEETIRRMYGDGYRVFLEVGPRGLMTSAVDDTLKGETYAAIALNSIHRTGILQAQHAIAQLAALGADMDYSRIFASRRPNRIDFDAAISMEVRRDAEMRLSRSFPRLTLLSSDMMLQGASFLAESKGRGAKAARRAAAVAHQARRQRQFDFGALNPLVSDADVIESTPGFSQEVVKVFKVSELPFLGDFALGSSQLSYSDPNLKGLIALNIPVGAEIMAEVASQVVPNRQLSVIEDLCCRRMVAFKNGELRLSVRAERVGSADPANVSIKVQLRDDSPNSVYTWPVMEGVFAFSETIRQATPVSVEPLFKPRSVHWSGRDIYPSRLCWGKRMRGIGFVESWSETGMNYEVSVPPLAGNVNFTRFPLWQVNPLLLGIIASGFGLWRSHERFAGAFSFPFKMRRLEIACDTLEEGTVLKCYLRLTGVTPKSHLCDIAVTDGNGKRLMAITGWEEYTERVPAEYRELILQPANCFLTRPVSQSMLGDPATDVSSAMVTDVPYALFERNEELWLKTLSRIILSAQERREFGEMPGSASRRTEWLFGRVAAKEAVRRFLKDYYQARWSDADVQIWADDSGKPHALGAWGDYLSVKIDIAIAHTSQFVIALAAANARVGVDVESVSRDLSEEFTAGVFTPEELELAAGAANSSQAVIRFWCAKEAVSKALGTGIRYSPKEMVIKSYQSDSGKLSVRLEGAWADAFKNFKGRDIPVTVRTMRDHALAFCFIPASLFGSD
jgi:phosphopantetheine--protein transferase-like protein